MKAGWFAKLQWSRQASVAALAGVLACSGEVPVGTSGEPALAKGKPGGSGNPTVSSVDPSYGHQNEVVAGIRIIGSGFDQSAVVAWERNGLPDPAITVLSTRFISSSELEVDIAISGEAALDLYDVAVMLAGGKRGVGIEAFEVTTAENLGVEGYPYGISETGQVSGYGSGALTWEDGVGLTNLGSGQSWGIDPWSAMVLGRNGDYLATAWIRQGLGSYQAQLLPRAGVGGNATAAARTSDGTLIVGGWDAIPGPRKNDIGVNRAAVWRLTGGVWTGPELYATPPGMTGSTILSINHAAQAAGVANGKSVGVIWENATTFTLLDGLPNDINPAGTIAVGNRNYSQPVYWYRNPVTQQWNPTGVALPTLGGTCEAGAGAQDINGAGIIVGQSCNSAGKVQATVWQLEFSGAVPTLVGSPVGLPGLGSKATGSGTHISGAKAITESSPYVIGGSVNYKGKTIWVRWRLMPE